MPEINISELLPQQPPFIMVDKLLHSDSRTTKTALTVREDNIFYKNGTLSETGLIENIAQTCAARMGYINRCSMSEKSEESQRVKVGVVGAIKNLVIEELPVLGETLTTTVEVTSELFSVMLVNAKIEIGEKTLASCEMKIAMTDMESEMK